MGGWSEAPASSHALHVNRPSGLLPDGFLAFSIGLSSSDKSGDNALPDMGRSLLCCGWRLSYNEKGKNCTHCQQIEGGRGDEARMKREVGYGQKPMPGYGSIRE
jgi:hypothetical protein